MIQVIFAYFRQNKKAKIHFRCLTATLLSTIKKKGKGLISYHCIICDETG